VLKRADVLADCKVCRVGFKPRNSMQSVCSTNCAITLASTNRKASTILDRETRRRAREDRRETKRKLDALKPRSKWLAEAQVAFNAFIRARDHALPCVSCSRFHEGKYDAGHYLTVGARPELRFDEANCWRQCVPCNRHLHGNVLRYRQELLRRIGPGEVARLEGPTAPKKYSIDDLRQIRDTYRAKARAAGKDLPFGV
jgi:hypothetical protein